jgi:hypothetical protein
VHPRWARESTPKSLILEATQLTGYPEGQLPTPVGLRGYQILIPLKRRADHGCAQAQNVAVEHP